MQALTLPARRGWRWIIDGYAIYSKSRLMLSLIVFSYWLLMMTVNSVPVVGQVIATICLPAMSVSMMNAFRRIEQGGPILPPVLFSGFSAHVPILMTLGGIYLCAALLIFAVTSLIDGGVLFNLFVVGGEFDETLSTNAVLVAAQIATVLFVPLVMAYWYAPILAAWHGYSAAKSLFFSLVACMRNWRAFLVYGFGLIGCGIALLMLSGLVSSVLSGAGKLSFLVVGFIGMPIVYASFYVSYRDVFVAVDENA
ncbi:BPSS1780 family membrane protein [uncultured Propionivibrio sp.]|uniref:BPSS1780 family membrane protein n=1 Tax=uncultured Propionivibrio sp. TaxID=426737 RepID=UPI0029BFC5D0|nr:BPSS1780 family membrane protein [uncultured Propionivibrio sp.]